MIIAQILCPVCAEGGFFAETFRDEGCVAVSALPLTASGTTCETSPLPPVGDVLNANRSTHSL